MIVFRADANEQVALGHLMRCLTIAKACRKKGETCEFWLAEDKETERLRAEGFPYRILGSDWSSLESELPLLKQILQQEEKPDWIVVDSYQATPQYLSSLNRETAVLYIDDMRQENYEVSALLQYIPCGGGRTGKAGTVMCLEGLQYTPLREEFCRSAEQKEREKSILITTGGTDPYNVAGRLVKCCSTREEFKEYAFHVILGSMNCNEPMLRRMAEENSQIRLHKNISNMSEYMRRCEMAVSAGGTTLLELCACGIPTVCFSFAENQKEFAKELGKMGAVRYAGDARENPEMEQELYRQLLFFRKDENERRSCEKRMKQLVDGKGAERIAGFLCEKR